jgi:hypothetical protein
MVRRSFGVLALAVVPFISIPTALASTAGAAPPVPVQDCLNGGWQTLTNASGQPFTSEGRCVAYALHHPVGLVDVVSSSPFSGTTGIVLNANNCAPIDQGFAASYPGSTNVGSVNLVITGCVNGIGVANGMPVFVMGPATFTVSTGVGTLTGTASGPVIPFSGGLDFQLTLTVTAGTGFFVGTTGSLQCHIEWAGISTTSFSGTISVP